MDVSRVCSELVAIKSENPPGSTKEVTEYIGNTLKGLGLSFQITDDGFGRANIFTDYKNKPLMFMGHLDVVPAIGEGWDNDPFSGEISDGYVHGRGSTDMKGGCAAILCAISETLNKGFTPSCNLCFVCDEESGGNAGVNYLLKKRLIRPCDCIIAEPTPCLNPAIGQKGLFRAEISFTGEPGHGSLYPAFGVSAIMKSFEFLNFIKELHQKDYMNETSLEEIINNSSDVLSEIYGIPYSGEILRKITYNPGKICGGEEMNIVAQRCFLSLEMRIPWGCRINELKEELSKHNSSPNINTIEMCDPNLTCPSEKIVAIACKEIERVYRKKSCPIVQWAASDARYLREKGFNAIEYGPGDLTTMHGKNEKVSVENLKKSVEIYAGIMSEYCI